MLIVSKHTGLAVPKQTTRVPALSSRRKPGIGRMMQQDGHRRTMPIKVSMSMARRRGLKRLISPEETPLSGWPAFGRS